MEMREVKKRARHPGQHGQGSVRRPEQQSVARGGEVRTATPRFTSRPDARRRSLSRAPSGKLAAEFTYKDAPLFAEARAISKFAQDLFLKGEVDAVDILYHAILFPP